MFDLHLLGFPVHALLGLLVAYFIGAVPTGLLLGRWMAGLDLREHGSKNIGFTNALRVCGPRVGVPVLLIDLGKAALAAWLIPALCPEPIRLWYPAAVGGVLLLGNLCNVFLDFKGGKGVATAAGVFLALAPVPVLIAAAVFLVTLAATRYVSLGSLLAGVALPSAIAYFHGPGPIFWVALAISTAVWIKHRGNIQRLLNGTERKIGRRTPPASPTS